MKKKSFNRKNLILTVVALLLVTLLTVGITYSWIEDITIVNLFQGSGDNAIPMDVGNNIDGIYNITATDNYINLGPLWKKEKINSEDPTSPSRDVLVGTEPVTTPTTHKDVVGRKGYYYESGGVHLTPCYGDGNTFYFKNNNDSFVKGNHDNYNVDLLSSTIQVNSPDAKTEFWFETKNFVIKDSSGNAIANADNYIRVAVIVDGITKVFSNNGSYKVYDVDNEDDDSSTNSLTKTGYDFDVYTHGNGANTNTRGLNGNTIFTVPKGVTKTVTFRVWLEMDEDEDDIDATAAVLADLNMQLISSWAYTRNISVENKTTGAGSATWIFNSKARTYLVIPDMASDPSDLTTYTEGAGYYELTGSDATDFSKDNDTVVVESVPAVYADCKMYLFRCTEGGFNSTEHTEGDAPVQRGGLCGGVYCWNWWETTIPDTYENEKYSLYGGSYDGTMQSEYSGTQTNKGYGTWSGVMTIDLVNDDTSTNFATHSGDSSHLFIEDYSDDASSGNRYYYTAYCYDKPTDKNHKWRVYIPTTSTKIQFTYHTGNSWGFWGFATQVNSITRKNASSYDDGYERPDGCNTFHITAGGSGDNPRGLGYWATNANIDNEIPTPTQATTAATQATTAPVTPSGTTTDITSSPSTTGLYMYGNLDGVNTNRLAKFTSTSVGGYVDLRLDTSKSGMYTFMLRNYTSNTSSFSEYGADGNGATKELSSNDTTNSAEEYRFIDDSGHRQNVTLNVTTNGVYRIEIKQVESTNFNIKMYYLSS